MPLTRAARRQAADLQRGVLDAVARAATGRLMVLPLWQSCGESKVR